MTCHMLNMTKLVLTRARKCIFQAPNFFFFCFPLLCLASLRVAEDCLALADFRLSTGTAAVSVEQQQLPDPGAALTPDPATPWWEKGEGRPI